MFVELNSWHFFNTKLFYFIFYLRACNLLACCSVIGFFLKSGGGAFGGGGGGGGGNGGPIGGPVEIMKK